MDNANKAIMIGVGLFLTIALITAVLFITGVGQNFLSKAGENVTDVANNTELKAFEKYNSTSVTGAEVLTTLNQYRDSEVLGVSVYNGSTANLIQVGKYVTFLTAWNTNGVTGGITKLTSSPALLATASKTAIRTYTDTTNANLYINPTTIYKADIATFNGKVVGIVFNK